MDVKKVMALLKPKAKAFGFNRKELAIVANFIIESLPEDMEEADEESEVMAKIESCMPILRLGQAQAQRSFSKRMKALTMEQNDEEDNDETDDNQDDEETGNTEDVKLPDDAPQWAKAMLTMFTNAMKTNKAGGNNSTPEQTKDDRRNQVKAVVDSLGAYGKTILRKFESKEFAKDEDFANYLDEIKSDALYYRQEAANIGLSKLSQPGAGSPNNIRSFEEKGMSDEELEELAKMY